MDVCQVKLSDHGISKSTNASKLSVAWLTRKMLMGNLEKSIFSFYFASFWGSSLALKFNIKFYWRLKNTCKILGYNFLEA